MNNNPVSEQSITYILLCANNTYYVGSTTNLEQRLKQHNAGHGSGFTKAHRPFTLVYTEEYNSYQAAFKRERQLHGWSHAKKEALIKGDIELLKELSKRNNIPMFNSSTSSPFSFCSANVVPEIVEGEEPIWSVSPQGN